MGYLYEKTYRKLLEKHKNQLIELVFWSRTIGLILAILLIFTNQAIMSPVIFSIVYLLNNLLKKIETFKECLWSYR